MIKVSFAPCGAKFHPAFENAVLKNDRFILEYPIKYLSKSKRAQKLWAQDKIAHLSSWMGSHPRIEN